MTVLLSSKYCLCSSSAWFVQMSWLIQSAFYDWQHHWTWHVTYITIATAEMCNLLSMFTAIVWPLEMLSKYKWMSIDAFFFFYEIPLLSFQPLFHQTATQLLSANKEKIMGHLQVSSSISLLLMFWDNILKKKKKFLSKWPSHECCIQALVSCKNA